MHVGLVLDMVLHDSSQPLSQMENGVELTAPYLEMCRTKSAASLKSGRGTIATIIWQLPRARNSEASHVLTIVYAELNIAQWMCKYYVYAAVLKTVTP